MKSDHTMSLLAWERAANVALLFAEVLHKGDEEGVQHIGINLDEAFHAAQSIIKSGYLEQEYERLQEYDVTNPWNTAMWFGFAAACQDFVRWIKNRSGAGRLTKLPILTVGETILWLKHMNWNAPINVNIRGVQDNGATRPIQSINQNCPTCIVDLNVNL